MQRCYGCSILIQGCCSWILAIWCVNLCAGAEFREDFDSNRTTWSVQLDEKACRVLAHRRHATIVRTGTGSENIELEVPRQVTGVQLIHKLPPSRVLDELTLSMWVRSNRAGAVLAIRVVFPNYIDPRTDRMMTTVLEGEKYTDAGSWQLLNCRTIDREIARRIRLLRGQFGPEIDTSDMYVDQARLLVYAGKGTTELFLDELKLTPVVSPRSESMTGIEQTGGMLAETPPPVELRLDRLVVGEQPFFPLMIPFHGERPDELAAMRFNPVWVPDFRDTELIAELRQRQLWTTATPPKPRTSDGSVLDARSASLAPFGNETDGILFWMLGAGISPSEKADLSSWREQLLGADRRYGRPLAAEVTGLERIYSRIIPMLGVTRNMQQTSFDYVNYRDWMLERHNLARPGSFLWTWIQTEPLPELVESRRLARQIPLILEPEQIRLQTYAALASGCRGIGYWTSRSLDDPGPGALERKLIIKQLNLELSLLEKWLATGTLMAQSPFTVPGAGSTTAGHTAGHTTNARIPVETSKGTLEAAILRTDHGQLLLPIWYGKDAQYVPGQMAANDATLVVPGVDEAAAAWEITSTEIRNLERKRVAGGIQITLPKFDMTTAIVITSDRARIEELRRQMESIRADSAAVSFELARAKFERVREVDQQLQRMGVGQPDGTQLIAGAQTLLEQAEYNLKQGAHHRARQFSNDVCQMLRILQRAHWEDAIAQLSHPVSSPHTICFQTLPDHWRMVQQFGRSPLSTETNLLRSGDFEDPDTIFAEGWGHEQNPLPGMRATAELYALPTRGNYCLRLAAAPAPGQERPTVIPRPPVRVVTPAVAVRSRQLVHVGGWVRVVTPIVGSLDGAQLIDSIGGEAAAITWRTAGEWHRFDLLREAQASGEFTLQLRLNGMGEVQFDDIRIIAQDPYETRQRAVDKSADNSRARSNLLPRFPRIPGRSQPQN